MKKKIMFIIRMSLKSELILFRTNDMLVTIKKNQLLLHITNRFTHAKAYS